MIKRTVYDVPMFMMGQIVKARIIVMITTLLKDIKQTNT